MRDAMQKAASEMETSVNSELSKTADDLNKSLDPDKPKEEQKAG
jgi:hypothetical protein